MRDKYIYLEKALSIEPFQNYVSILYKMLNNLKLGAKFNLLLLLIFVGGVSLSGWALSTILNRSAEDYVTSKALILLETMNSVRNYTNTQVNPELTPRLDTEEQFLPQTVPAYSAREVFENLRTKEEYSNFFYKEATLNPTNPRDKADEFETKIVDNFRNQSGLKEITGFRSVPSGDLFYVARPLPISKESCLRCHSTPEAAPKSQLATYGRENGFGWKLNEIVAAQIMSVPASDVVNNSRRSLSLLMGILIGIFTVAILLVNFLLRHTVIKPLKQMSKVAKDVSTGNLDAEFEHKSNDEIGVLAASFNRMKVSLQLAMNMLNQGGS
jgi:HAMP domain-containing protein